ncbi:MAG: hypothetical protein IBX56_19690 [Methylomicrobium sp.]|nr:hypothetical protein [Methylomicrobium sp.]
MLISSISQAKIRFQQFFKLAIQQNREFLAQNAKETSSDETVSIIRTKLLDEWLDRAYTFNPLWEYDSDSRLWSVILTEIGIATDALTKEEAVDQLVELVQDYCDDYFDRLPFFTSLPDRNSHYPYLRRVSRCKNADQLRSVLGLVT